MKPPCGQTGERTGSCAWSLSALGSVFLLGIYYSKNNTRIGSESGSCFQPHTVTDNMYDLGPIDPLLCLSFPICKIDLSFNPALKVRHNSYEKQTHLERISLQEETHYNGN